MSLISYMAFSRLACLIVASTAQQGAVIGQFPRKFKGSIVF